MPQDMSLGDFVKQLASLLHKKEVKMPFKNERPWHLLFYQLKNTRDARGRPAFFDDLQFDWDGPYPKSQELSEFLHALHWNATVSASNPQYETITLPNEVAELWSQRVDGLDTAVRQFLSDALERARPVFSEIADTGESANDRNSLAS